MGQENDLMVLVESLLAAGDFSPLPGCRVGIIRQIDEPPDEMEFPFAGILDGGDSRQESVSEGIDKQVILVVVYEESVGNARNAVLDARERINKIRSILERRENFYSSGAFADFQGVTYQGSSEGIPATMRDTDKDVAVKAAKFEFYRHYCLVEEL